MAGAEDEAQAPGEVAEPGDDQKSVRVGARTWLLRAAGILAGLAGVTLGVLAWTAFAEAAEDEDAIAAITAEREEVAVQLATKERRRERRLDRIAANQEVTDELLDAVLALLTSHSAYVARGPGPGSILDEAVALWNAGDHAGAVAVLDAELVPHVAELRNLVRQMEFAAAVVSRGARQLPEPPR